MDAGSRRQAQVSNANRRQGLWRVKDTLVCFRQVREALPGEVAVKQRIEKHCDNLRRVETSLQIKGGAGGRRAYCLA